MTLKLLLAARMKASLEAMRKIIAMMNDLYFFVKS